MGSVEECAYRLTWDGNEIHMGDLCVCVLEELHSLHIGESTEEVCEGLHGTGIGCPRGMYGECRGAYGAAALPCSAPMPATGHSLGHAGASGLSLPSPTPMGLPRAHALHICLGTSKSGARDLF